MSAIIFEDEIVHYEVLGRGRPVIYLHSWVGSWRYWIPSMQAASVSYRAYALDMWGFGDSAKNTTRYLISQQLRLLNGFLYQLGIGRVALVGHGLGAIVALKFAEQYPQVVDRVMAVEMPFRPEQIDPRLKHETPESLASWLLSTLPEVDATVLEAPKSDRDALYQSIQFLEEENLSELLTRLQSPCLLVHGKSDPAVKWIDDDFSATLPPHFHLILFEECGHFPMLENPSQFNRLMVDFLALPSGESPRVLALKEEWKRRVR
ncbi:MAG: alpha/beta hydrolase [Anaerolineae bacterium]|nr:MAG: alpha/beta hydrolase [Anaerolineae bacterium]